MMMSRFTKGSLAGVVLGFFFYSISSFAFLENSVVPDCMAGKQEIRINNEQVLNLKKTARNGVEYRAFVAGRLVQSPWIKNKHVRFIMSIGPDKKDLLEVIYNLKFGAMPQISPTAEIKVCGDFINSNQRHNGYDASPAGAVIHWVHFNPGTREMQHEHGFIMVDDKLVGFDEAESPAWQGEVTYSPLRSERGNR